MNLHELTPVRKILYMDSEQHGIVTISLVAFVMSAMNILICFATGNISALLVMLPVTLMLFSSSWLAWKNHVDYAKKLYITSPIVYLMSFIEVYDFTFTWWYIGAISILLIISFWNSRTLQQFIVPFAVLAFIFLSFIYLHFSMHNTQLGYYGLFIAALSFSIISAVTYILINIYKHRIIGKMKSDKRVINVLQQENKKLADELALLKTKVASMKEEKANTDLELEMREVAMKALEESEERYQALFEHGFAGTMIFDTEEFIPETCNNKILEMLEVDYHTFLSSNLLDYFNAYQENNAPISVWLRQNMQFLKQEEKVKFEIKLTTKAGCEKVVEMTAVTLPAPNKHLAIAILEDVTEQVKMKQSILNSNQELKHFARAASHDLKEPLRMINSFGQLLGRHNKDLDATSEEYLHFITDASKRMLQLVDDLLTYSTTGTQRTPTKAVNLNDTILLVQNNLRLRIMETDTNIIVKKELPTVQGHASLLTQLFQNIIANAIKFRKPETPSEILINMVEHGDDYLFAIKDNGIGIPKDKEKQVFDAFKRLHAKTDYEGSGIGLATCKKIVNAYGGEIWANSEEGIGTTIYFTIPRNEASNRTDDASMVRATCFNV